MNPNIDAFVEQLRKQVMSNAKGKSGQEVIEALFSITDEMWDGGADLAWQQAAVTADWEMFDITWLTMLASRLALNPKKN